MFDFFGPNIPQAAKFFIAFLVVLALIGIVAWLVRRFGSSRLGGSARGRDSRGRPRSAGRGRRGRSELGDGRVERHQRRRPARH